MTHRYRALLVCAVVSGFCLTPGLGLTQVTFDFSAARNGFFYGYYGQLGKNGFFGEYDRDASTTGNFAALNSWVGNRENAIGVLTSGTNAALASMDLDVNPRLGTDWIKATGRYIIRTYDIGTTQGADVPVSAGQLTMWSLVTETPIGRIVYGKQGFLRGLGLQFSTTRTHDYLLCERVMPAPNLLGGLVAARLLPPRVLQWYNPDVWPRYPGLSGDEYKKKCEPSTEVPEGDEEKEFERPMECDPYAMGSYGPGRLVVGLGLFPWQRIANAGARNVSWNEKDLSASRVRNFQAYLEYYTTELVLGLGGLYISYHTGPEFASTIAARRSAPPADTFITEGWAFLQWNNGRFFFNTELDWYNSIIRYQRSLDGTFEGQPDNFDGSGSLFRPRFVESWRYFSEGGFWFGPLVMRLCYGFMPGPDRRHGVRIDRQPFIQADEQAGMRVFEPYSVLLSFQYGGGVDAPGHISDASLYGAGIQYAIAANLVVEGSILKAVRTSDGYGWGYIRPDPANFGTVNYDIRGTFSQPSPTIPDKDLGVELTAGLTWKLVETWIIGARLAWWKPGKWFNYACVDRSMPGWNFPTSANNWGVNPNRTIDPVVAIELRFGGTW